MKFFSLFFLTCFFYAAGFAAATPPKPISGKAIITPGKGAKLSTNEFSFNFSLPPKWGIGESSFSSANRTSLFTVFPQATGFGCQITVTRFENETQLQNEFAQIKKNFSAVLPISNGFEANFQSAFFSCRKDGLHLIQTWYSLPKTPSKKSAMWKTLKKCVSVTPNTVVTNVTKTVITRLDIPGFCFGHPSKNTQISYIPSISDKCALNTDRARCYDLAIDNNESSTLLYLDWDPKNTKSQAPYKKMLEKILADLKNAKIDEKLSDSVDYYLDDRLAIWEGYPYTLVTVAKDDYLVGCAIKMKFSVVDIDRLFMNLKHWEN